MRASQYPKHVREAIDVARTLGVAAEVDHRGRNWRMLIKANGQGRTVYIAHSHGNPRASRQMIKDVREAAAEVNGGGATGHGRPPPICTR